MTASAQDGWAFRRSDGGNGAVARGIALAAALCASVARAGPAPKAAPRPPDKPLWSFVVYSDNRGAGPLHRQTLRTIRPLNPDLVLNCGDWLFPGKHSGRFESYQADVTRNFGPWELWQRRFYPAIGGHEEVYFGGREPDNARGQLAYDLVRLRERVDHIDLYGDYAFTHRGVHFLVLYASDEWLQDKKMYRGDDPGRRREASAAQFVWLLRRLRAIRAASPRAPIVVMAHQKAWFHEVLWEPNHVRSHWARLLVEHKVDLALAGDMHDYYVNTGGGILRMRAGSIGYGVALYLHVQVFADRFEIVAHRPDGKVLIYPLFATAWRKPFGQPPQPVAWPAVKVGRATRPVPAPPP